MTASSLKHMLRRSPVTMTLLALNISVFILDFFMHDLFYHLGYLSPDLVMRDGEYRRLLTACFLHADFSHIFSNMLLLGYIGIIIERNLGNIRFALLYLFTGVFGNIVTVIIETLRGEDWTSIGASGAVFGIIGAMLVLVIKLPKEKRYGSSFPQRLGLMIIFSLYTGMRSTGTNNIAHVAGLIAGMLITSILTFGRHDFDLRGML